MSEPLQVIIVGPDGLPANVTAEGTLITGTLPAEPVAKTLDAINTAFSFFPPKAGQQFCITQIILSTNKDVGVNGATVDIYEGASESATTIARSIYRFKPLKNSFLPLTPIVIVVSPDVWLLAKTDDDVVEITIGGFYLPEIGNL